MDSQYDRWKTTTPEDEEDAQKERERKNNARMEAIIDEWECEPDEWEL